jgi:hypothetical protein
MRVSLPRRAPKKFNVFLQIVVPRHMPQVIADLLVQAFAHRAQFLPRSRGNLLVDGKGNIHSHSICAHITCVNKVALLQPQPLADFRLRPRQVALKLRVSH